MADNSKSVAELAKQIAKAQPNWSHRRIKQKARDAVLRTERPTKK